MNRRSITKNTRQYRYGWWIVVFLLLLIGMAWFFSNYRKVELGTIYLPNSTVTKNRYFIAAKLLGAKATTVQSRSQNKQLSALWEAPAKHQTVIWHSAPEQTNNPKQMIQWVMDGGHLIVYNQDEDGEQLNPLLTELGIEYQPYDYTQSAPLPYYYEAVPLQLPTGQTIVVDGARGKLEYQKFLELYPQARLMDYRSFSVLQGDNYWRNPAFAKNLTDKEQKVLPETIQQGQQIFNPENALLDILLGEGRLTVLANESIFDNPRAQKGLNDDDLTDNSAKQDPILSMLTDKSRNYPHNYRGGILEADNALLLQYLTKDSQEVYLVPEVATPPTSTFFGFMQLFWQYARWSMMGLLTLIVLGILALPKRFGAIKSYQTDVSYNIFGFFAHVGRYLWRSDQAFGVLLANRQALIQTIIAKEQIHDPDSIKIVATVAQKTGLSVALIEEALYMAWQNPAEFLRISRSFALLMKHYPQ